MLKPLVSIITPLYKAENWLKELFKTIDGQVFRDFEHILVDDNGHAEGLEALKQLVSERPNCVVLSTGVNSGPAIARNIGIAHARGRYIAFLDADDVWHPRKLQTQIEYMTSRRIAFCFHDYRHMSPDGALVGPAISGPDILDFPTHHKRRGTGGCLSVMLDQEQLKGFSFPLVEKRFPEDYLAWLEIINRGVNGHRLPQVLGLYRLSPNSRSADKLTVVKSVWEVYRDIERLPLPKAGWWWSHYVLNALLTYKQAKPRLPRSSIDF